MIQLIQGYHITGGALKWQYSKIIIKHIKNNSNEQKQQ